MEELKAEEGHAQSQFMFDPTRCGRRQAAAHTHTHCARMCARTHMLTHARAHARPHASRRLFAPCSTRRMLLWDQWVAYFIIYTAIMGLSIPPRISPAL